MNIFLSTPISSFKNEKKLEQYRIEVLKLIDTLRVHHSVCAEIERFGQNSDFDTPDKSIEDDLNAIQSCDLFLMHYPTCVPSSALLELGFAISQKKQVIIVTPQKSNLPYLAQGIQSYIANAHILETKQLDDATIDMIVEKINNEKQSLL